VYQEAPELERRLSELQSQIDRLTVSLHLWRESQDHLQPMERRLAQITEQCAEVVERSAMASERVRQDAAAHLQELQRAIELEWTALRGIHEEPVRQLREQAATLTEISAATASSALTTFDRAEARLAGLELNLHRRLGELTDVVQSAVSELRAVTARQALALPAPTPSWPLDGVVRLHNQLRSPDESAEASPLPTVPAEARAALPEATSALSERLETLERAVSDGQTQIRSAAERTTQTRRVWWGAAALVVLALIAAGIIVTRLQRQITAAAARVTAAEQQAQAATRAANEQIVAARDTAAQQIADARATALRAQTISDVLAAPDLVRYNLAGGAPGARFTAQVLWSRSRGLVFSASRLPAPPPDSSYQIWLLTSGEPVSAGVFVPDTSGRFTLATDAPPRVPRAVSGVAVTVERAGGVPAPTGVTLLARAQ
jgi:anti-sigma-K factor RskA